jgi:hypothetical protein
MNVTLYNQQTTQAESVTISTLDDLRMLSEAYFGIMPDNQLFTVGGRPINMNSTLDTVGLKSDDMIVVTKTDFSTDLQKPDAATVALADATKTDDLNQTIFDVKEQLLVDNSIPYTLLYLPGEINDIAFRIVIDTGASASVMSESLSKMLKINGLIDDRTKGTAVGIGNTNILGLISGCNVKLCEDTFVPVSFSVLEDGFDKYMAILGLDFLTSHKCKIDFVERLIEVNGKNLRFLNEMEVQRMATPYNVIETRISSRFDKFSDSLKNRQLTLDLLTRIVHNIIENPNDDKFKKINTNSKMILGLNEDMPAFVQYLLDLNFKPDDVEKHRYSFKGSIEHLNILNRYLSMKS